MANKRPVEVSPLGTVVYAWLHKPQPPHPKNKSKDAKPMFSVTLLLPINDPKIKAWAASIKALIPNIKETPFEPRIDKLPFKVDKGDKKRAATGDLMVKFSSAFASIIVDAKRNALPPGRFPAEGSTVKVAYVAKPYDIDEKRGVKLYLQGIQVISLVEYEGKKLPFTDEEGFERDPNDKGVAPDARAAAAPAADGPTSGPDDTDLDQPPDDDDSDLPF
jgi:hypothetical protein